MILVRLFLTFFEIGTLSFGGGYGMISLIREKILENGWLAESEFMDFIAVSESTPGPLAVNMATFIGASKAGFFGALAATLGVVLPSFIIIIIIAALIKNLLKYSGIQAFLSGIRPTVVGLILATAITMGLRTLFSFEKISDLPAPDIKALIILTILLIFHITISAIHKKRPSPIFMILVSAGLGIVLYS